jgi:hypothetical protein
MHRYANELLSWEFSMEICEFIIYRLRSTLFSHLNFLYCNILLSTIFPKAINLCFSFRMGDRLSHSYKLIALSWVLREMLSISRNITCLLRNPKYHCLVHKSSPAEPIMSQVNRAKILTCLFRSSLVLRSRLFLRLPSVLYPSGFPVKCLYAFIISPSVLYVPLTPFFRF